MVHLKRTMKKVFRIFFLPAAVSLGMTCTEPFEPQTVTFESALVIDATITNEMKQHELFLSRTYRFEQGGPNEERNANVKIVDGVGNEFTFQETSPGTYVSEVAFSALAGTEYQLMVTTSNGRSYTSEMSKLPAFTQIDDLYAERLVNDDGVEGMAIMVDSYDASGNSKNYRYEYEETYKIIAPEWTTRDLIGDPAGGCGLLVVPREGEEQVCYATVDSNSLILTDTNGFTEDRVSRFVVRFINRDNYILSHRYSILVRQFVQSNPAYTFFETLDEFSGSESLFSESQPGFLSGNVFSEEDPNEKVLGYFDVASVTERRLFFDYEDFFPGEALPPYIEPCVRNAPPLAAGIPPRCVLRTQVESNLVRYVDLNDSPEQMEGPYVVVPRVCGDCTEIGQVAVPPFWVED